MSESINARLQGVPDYREAQQLKFLLDAILADITALRASILLITAKLDADATVTDTNYAATCDPAALTTTS